ncbi:probable phosphoglycerate mutase [Streptomyces sp. DvalAA-14]|uniref:histidine phosphatase family protein n=1 Tax=unclassified Streptomyces TaxID=2593676 RepID=UPI00081B8C44|nr:MULTISPECIES: histidine phosphatase family protein [unclassified Streptomyces]MYS20683.1 histidine phosphatase family protein [Streptomyces sp. SID4948]SCD74613.1 probable phosphoglycerate mutase [Streptomyces sp. DvalAA-14]
MGELVLIRHGETEWTRSGQHTSYTDLPLTAHGEDQARTLAALLGSRPFVSVFVSPMLRARQTAKLAGLDEIQIDPDLREWDYGGYEGVTTHDIHRTRPDWDLWRDGVVPGPDGHRGETAEQVGERADRVLSRVDEAFRADGDGDILLVAHAHLLRVLTARRLGLPPTDGALFLLETGTVSRLGEEHGRPVLTAWNRMG